MRCRLAVLALPVLALLIIGTGARAASLPPTESTTGLVVSSQRLAAEAGIDMLRRGGNAVDAAVAVGYAEAVVNPCCGNIGGGGFLVAHLAGGRDVFLNFRETAPAAASRDMYLGPDGQPVRGASRFGWKAVAVPGTVLGLDTALAKYGTLPRATVMAPAIRLALEGFVLTGADAGILRHVAPLLRRDPAAAAVFLHPDGSPERAGERLRQPALAATLEAIADHGPDAFYAGAIPQAVAQAARAGGGLITATDFAAYHVTEAPPLRCSYRGYVILSAPPPSSGGVTLCETLHVLEGYDLRGLGFHSAESVHLLTEALRLAFFDRAIYLGDPAFVTMPLDRLLSRDYAVRLRGLIGDRATSSASLGPAVPPPNEKPETTHFSVLDAAGNAVAVTTTINGAFGAGVEAPGTGFLLNDEMDDFTVKADTPNMFGLVQGAANAIAPGKRPVSSMTPSIVLKDGALRMVIGSPGGPRIITATLETILNVVEYGMNAQEAVDAPRLHHQWQPDVLFAEPYALSPDTKALLERMGYRIVEQRPWGAVALIAAAGATTQQTDVPADSVVPHVVPGGAFQGAADPRRPAGAALAP
ncbi:gamma-glutamyltransferase [Rhodopila globiformis]|uniref:Glutathione hydrolase proenzyme n=1 Tax=Rhodopila globiformis TaxID=1071 RepID=A0A2S6NNW2_RHOGL|nr:gamma-glutamyltransferase [Rhodopila globiformis]PPQ39536.1 gamma-glutamyltransferase [Rhodopila globiformis]